MITIIKEPALFSPAKNPVIWEFGTNNNSTLYFNVIVKNAKNDEIIAKNKIYLAPENKTSSIDLSPLLSAYTSTPIIKNDAEINSYDTTIEYSIEVTEISATGTTVDNKVVRNSFFAYNSKLDNYQLFDFLKYNIDDDSESNFLTSFPINQKIHYSTDFRLYILSNRSDLKYFKITLQTTDNIEIIKNINFDGGDNILHSVLISPRQLGNEFDYLPQHIKNIKVTGYDARNLPLTEARTFFITTFKCGTDVVNLHWENKEGGIDSFAFTQPKKQISVIKETIDTNQYLNKINGVYSTNKKILDVNSTVTYTVTTPALSDWGYDKISEIITSKNVYVEDASGDLVPIFINENSINLLQKRYTKKFNHLTLSFTTGDNINLNIYTDSNINNSGGFDYQLDIML